LAPGDYLVSEIDSGYLPRLAVQVKDSFSVARSKTTPPGAIRRVVSKVADF